MQIGEYYFVIGIWDIISLLLPVAIVLTFMDVKRKHATRMNRLDMLYGEAEVSPSEEDSSDDQESSSIGEQLHEELVDEQIQ